MQETAASETAHSNGAIGVIVPRALALLLLVIGAEMQILQRTALALLNYDLTADEQVSANKEKEGWLKASIFVLHDHSDELELMLMADPELANRTVSNTFPRTLLHEACTNDSVKCVGVLLRYKVDPLKKRGSDQETALHVAARTDSVRAIELLLNSGVDVNVIGGGDPDLKIPGIITPLASPLDCAATAGSERAVELLLQRGAKGDINPKRSSYSALHRAMEGRYDEIGFGNPRRLSDSTLGASCGNQKIIEMLLKHGCSLDEADFLGNTPFHIALRSGAIDSVKFLLDSHKDEVNVSRPGQFGYTAAADVSIWEFTG